LSTKGQDLSTLARVRCCTFNRFSTAIRKRSHNGTMALTADAEEQGNESVPSLKPGVWRISTVKLLVALILLFAMSPIVEDLPNGDLVESGLMTVVLIASLVAVNRNPRVLIVAALLFVPALAGKWLNHVFPNHISPLYFPAFGIAFFGFTIYQILRFILRTGRVDAGVLSAGIVVYLMLGLLWSLAYLLLAQLTPGSFSFALADSSASRMDGFNAFYFSFGTLTTVGFGDITPVSKVARTLAVMEVSRLVGMYSTVAHIDAPQCSDRP
jgi:voltage-gated potassium channel